MKIRYYILGFLITAIAFLTACEKKEDLAEQVNAMNFSHNLRTPTAIDNWLTDSITKPFNIQVKYYWDRSELSRSSLVPVDESKVLPVSRLLLNSFLLPYKAESSDFFIKTYPPKQIILVGSAESSPNEIIAGSGRKITFYSLNYFDPNNRVAVTEQIRTIHHDFAHVLMQYANYNAGYKTISNQADYIGSEAENSTLPEAYAKGFITLNARNEPDEDFADMIAVLLVGGQKNFDNILMLAGTDGANRLRRKEAMVIDYYRQIWNIDFRALQTRIQNALPPEPTLASQLGYGKKFTQFQFLESNTLIQKSQAFAGLLPAIKSELFAYGSRSLDYLLFNFNEIDGELRLRIYSTISGTSSNNSLRFKIIPVTPTTFKLQQYDPASGSLFNATPTLRNYLNSNTFKIDYQGSSTAIGGLYVVGQESTNFVTGLLQ
ncbi:substrate import-associated zinc metallohydrolase lipoprotein [Pedobacter agri]|uniref:substrate import-associated zinc metallohydrolase lipoprotein n=1 Tax=Pedobacter agri TaxID=454586 RepID=UPI002931791B|nr:substrate import-associated zinc metallohydrolase lipoprotein [Pedobacter agri]